jgi:hypothetical protein
MIKVNTYPEPNILYLNKEEISSIKVIPETFDSAAYMEISMKNGNFFKVYYNSDLEVELKK